MTFDYKVMIESNSNFGFGKYGGPNEFSMLWSTSVPNFMLVDKSAQYPFKTTLRAWTINNTDNLMQ